MRVISTQLINTPEIELWPGGLLRARGNHDARLLSRARHVLRRKRDGRFLAAALPGALVPLLPGLRQEAGFDAAVAALHRRGDGVDARQPVSWLPLDRLHERLSRLGLDDHYGARTGLPLVREPDRLALAGFDRYRRPMWLHVDAAHGWSQLQASALRDGIALDAISGYRSHDYQLGIFDRKRARGHSVDEILTVNAAPGYSEHHSGLALDIGAPGEPPAEESFERTAAFSWLGDHAADHGFHMSYPRGNPHGIVYEPWHWRYGAC